MNILIVEDDLTIREELSKFLETNNFSVSKIIDFNNVLEKIKDASPHLVLLDINLPQMDGYSICRKLRESSDIPVIILTSRDTEMDELMSMNLGADDFIKKPFNPQILLARIERLIKRSYQTKQTDIIEHLGIKLDLVKGVVEYHNNVEVLTKNELSILHYLFIHKGELVSREDLIIFLWDSSSFVDDNTLSVNMTRLRKKLESLGVNNPIETRRGLGYVLL
ncbi:MAG: response regulator transcription factor [Oscillospiraceae bacterium]